MPDMVKAKCDSLLYVNTYELIFLIRAFLDLGNFNVFVPLKTTWELYQRWNTFAGYADL